MNKKKKVKFDSHVTVKTMDVDWDQHRKELRNPPNYIIVDNDNNKDERKKTQKNRKTDKTRKNQKIEKTRKTEKKNTKKVIGSSESRIPTNSTKIEHRKKTTIIAIILILLILTIAAILRKRKIERAGSRILADKVSSGIKA